MCCVWKNKRSFFLTPQRNLSTCMFLGLPILISQVRLFNNTFSYKSNSFLDICSPGKCSDTGLEPCFPCPKGYFQPHPGLSFCYRCPQQVLQYVRPLYSHATCA